MLGEDPSPDRIKTSEGNFRIADEKYLLDYA